MEIKVGDIAYSRQIHPTSTWGPWESDPFKIIDVTFNQVTGERRGEVKTRDRGDWKLIKERPSHLQLEEQTPVCNPYMDPDFFMFDHTPLDPPARNLRPSPAPRQPPRNPRPQPQPRHRNPTPPPPPARLNKNICPECATLFKLFDGRRTCSCKEKSLGHQLGVDTKGKSLDIVDKDGKQLGTIAYIRGMDDPRHTDIGPIPDATSAVVGVKFRREPRRRRRQRRRTLPRLLLHQLRGGIHPAG